MHIHLSNPLAHHPPSYARRKDYRVGRVLGEGTFGIVRLATWTAPSPHRQVCIKVIPKRILKGNLHLVQSETAVVKELSHPNIVRLYDDFESKDKFYLVFEPAMGGEVFERVLHTGHLTEHEAAHVVKSAASALAYIHSHGFVHRDIKPENIMYLTDPDDDPDARIVLVDFGVAQHLNYDGEKLRELAGSLGYAAPEVVARKPYGKEVDMWSLGAVAYVMLSGHMPYKNQAPEQLLDEMLSGPVQFTGKYWSQISEEGKAFIRDLMNTDAEKRLTAEQALAHPWILHNADTPSSLASGGSSGSSAARPNIAAGLKDNYQLRPKTRAPTLAPSSFASSRATTQHDLVSDDENDDENDADTEPDARSPTNKRSPMPPLSPLAPAAPEPNREREASSAGAGGAESEAASLKPTSTQATGHSTPSTPGTDTETQRHHSIVEGIKNMIHPHRSSSHSNASSSK